MPDTSHCCCEDCVTRIVNVNLTCLSVDGVYVVSRRLKDAVVEIKDSGGTVIGTGTTSAWGFVSVDISPGYSGGAVHLTVAKTDYRTISLDLDPLACVTNLNLNTCWIGKIRVNVAVRCKQYPPDANTSRDWSGVAVSVTGTGSSVGISGSGTTDANGDAEFSLSGMPGDITDISDMSNCGYTLDITAEHPLIGGADQTKSVLWLACVQPGYAASFILEPDADHTGFICGDRYIPKVLSYSDDQGSCDITWDNPTQRWIGGYDYNADATESATCQTCVGSGYSYPRWVAHAATIPIGILLDITATATVENPCGDLTAMLTRTFPVALAYTSLCGMVQEPRMVPGSSGGCTAYQGASGTFAFPPSGPESDPQDVDCSGSLLWSFPYDGVAIYGASLGYFGEIPGTEGTATITE